MKNFFKFSRPQSQIIDVNRNKSAILNFIQPLSNLSENCLLVTCITNVNRIHEKLFKFPRPQGQIIDVKYKKITKIRLF